MKIKTDINKRLCDISPLLYGAFFEDINYGADGGLYAELIANRSFEYYDRSGAVDKHKMCWEPLIGTVFEICTQDPINRVHTHYAHIKGGSGCGIRNTGFCNEGFAVRPGQRFMFSCYVITSSAVLVSITDEKGRVIGSGGFDGKGGDWVRTALTIETAEECGNARLSVTLPDGGEMMIDFISLFPEDTFMRRENGLRKDIAEMIAELHPKFLRFPGGCVVEGRSFENMYRWKDTVGMPEERRTNWNRWQMDEYKNLGADASDYFQSYGLGFFEYFLFCEDIGAEPVPVVNCGMTCQWHEALKAEPDEMEKYVNDALDLIEFANSSDGWGRLRLLMGHPEPFGLKYLAIGNEQWGDEYFERYEMFEEAIKKKYPEIKLITSAGWKNRGWEYDLAYSWMRENKDKAFAVDEHFYKEPQWFLDNTGRYDGYDRTLPKVFIGEWAAHLGADAGSEIRERRNTWYAALCEAAFLTGIERNADHVVMTCYAPLLGRIGHSQWQPDLIWFDTETVFGTPSYYVQKLFSDNLPEYAVGCTCEDDDIKVTAGVRDGVLILKAVNISDEKKTVTVEGAEEMEITELFAEPDAENSARELKVYPRTRTAAGEVDIAPYSVTVMKLRINRGSVCPGR